MSTQRNLCNIALIGFMGTGKSTVGRIVAELLRFEFVDTDDLSEQRSGKTIREIFAQDGEAAFRQMEKQIVAELATRRRLVISAGGGLAAQPGNLDSLKTHALVICLWATPEKIWQRVRHQTHRPLLECPDPLAKITALLAEREPFYRQADVMLNTELRPIKAVAQQVAHQFHLARSARE